MSLSRRHFHWKAIAAGISTLTASRASLVWGQAASQPFAAHADRLLNALQALGEPLPIADERALRAATSPGASGGMDQAIAILDRRVLLKVRINPEMRLSVSPGGAPATLVQGGWRVFLVEVRNEASATSPFLLHSPQALPGGRPSSLAITGVHDFTNGAVDAVESAKRWLALNLETAPPMTATLSGLPLEYRIVSLYSRDAGAREASFTPDLGFGEQDLGFRSTLPILFHCAPAHTVTLRIQDERGAPSMASLRIADPLGRIYPAQTKRELPDLAFETQIYRADGETLRLPAGDYAVEYGRGPEYLRQQTSLRVGDGDRELALALRRWVQPAAHGYYSGDTHIHAAGCSHYESPAEGVAPEVMQRQVEGEALDVGAVLNWGPGFAYQKQFFSAHVLPSSPAQSLLRYDVEVSGFPSSHSGHLVLLRLHNDEYPNARSIDDWPSWNLPILRWAKAQGAVTGYAHAGHGLVTRSTELPNYIVPPFDSMGANEFLVDITHPGTIDFLSGCDLWPFAELNVWYHTQNCGFRTAFAGETDFPCITDACVGGGRSYAVLPEVLPRSDAGYDAWLNSLLSGPSYFGDGRSHIFNFTASAPTGSGARPVTVAAEVCARLEPEVTPATSAIANASPYDKPYWHLERARIGGSRRVAVELICNGEAIARTEIVADGSIQKVSFTQQLTQSSWLALRIMPSSHTNPIVIEVDGKPVRASRRSAEWCRRSVDACWDQKRPRIRTSELSLAAAAYDHARAAYDLVLAETTR